jgi:hypothetical protein
MDRCAEGPGTRSAGGRRTRTTLMTRTPGLAIIRSCISALARAVVVILGLAATGGGDFPRI